MKKKILSILLSTVLISQIGMISQTPTVYAEGGHRSAGQRTQSGGKSWGSHVLSWTIGGILMAAGIGVYRLRRHLLPKPKSEPEPKPVQVPEPANQEPEVQALAGLTQDAPMEQRLDVARAILERYANPSYVIPTREVYQACDKVIPRLRGESSLLKLDGKFWVVGDVHGDFRAVSFVANCIFEEVPKGTKFLFLGDYVDRGSQSIEIAILLFILKIMFPNQVYLLRGNHETISVNAAYGLYEECKKKYDDVDVSKLSRKEQVKQYLSERNNDTPGIKVYHKINSVFDNLSLAAVVNGSTFCV
ncbi:MAG: metallophosphoesterase, partial [Oscillospiraceae bacterium]|nr:metallophosphoesterase [Oscillospiraceae bacterium]